MERHVSSPHNFLFVVESLYMYILGFGKFNPAQWDNIDEMKLGQRSMCRQGWVILFEIQ